MTQGAELLRKDNSMKIVNKDFLEQKAKESINRDIRLNRVTVNERESRIIAYGEMPHNNNKVHVNLLFDYQSEELYYWWIEADDVTLSTYEGGEVLFGNHICISDPSYSRSVGCMTEMMNVKPGRWKVFYAVDELDMRGERTYAISLLHNSVTDKEDLNWIEGKELGVDSHRLIVIGDRFYRRKNGSAELFEADEKAKADFAAACENISSSELVFVELCGTKVGVICTTGTGSGMFPLRYAEKEGEIIAIEVLFYRAISLK